MPTQFSGLKRRQKEDLSDFNASQKLQCCHDFLFLCAFSLYNALQLTKPPFAYIVSLGLGEEKSSPDIQELA